MAKTIETYVRQIDPAGMRGDREFFVGDERSRLVDALYIPSLGFEDIGTAQAALRPLLGETADQAFAVKAAADFNLTEPNQGGVTLATGICPFPMDYNAALNPAAGPGTARWYRKETGEAFTLSADFQGALEQIIENPPAISVANLMKAGCMSVAKTVLIEEVDFYAEWMLGKLYANTAKSPTDDEREAAKLQLIGFVKEQYDRNTRCFEAMRRVTQKVVELDPVIRAEDTASEYQAELDEQVARWQKDLPGGELLDVSGLKVAAYYSPALVKAYRGMGLLSASEVCVIAEGAANLLIPDNGTPFNTARRRAFGDLAKNLQAPGLLAYPSPALSPSVRKQRLEAEPISSSPSTIEPDVSSFYRYSKKPSGDVLAQPEFQWSLATPGTPKLRQLQAVAVSGDMSAAWAMTAEINSSIAAIFESEL